MFKPFGLLKKVFNPKSAFKGINKAVKGVAGVAHKAVSKLPGPKPPGFGRLKPRGMNSSSPSKLTPKTSMTSSNGTASRRPEATSSNRNTFTATANRKSSRRGDGESSDIYG